MKKWYFTVALLAAWFGQSGSVTAQSHLPTPYGPARMPEPLPYGAPDPSPPLVPGPFNPESAPVAAEGTNFAADHTSAFQLEEFCRDDHWFVHPGAVGLMRQKLGNEGIVFGNPQSLKNGFGLGPNEPIMVNLNDIGQDYNFGPKLTAGYVWQNEAIEVTGFWIPNYSNLAGTQAPGQLDLPFHNPPLGFEGDNGLWLHADNELTTFKSRIWGGEINYRYNDAAVLDVELILGLRYMDVYESMGIYTGDNDFTFASTNGPDTTRQATYQVQTRNHIVAPQIGFEYGHKFTDYFTLGINAKTAIGVDFAETHSTLIRGDGLVGFDNKHYSTIAPSGIFDGGAFLDFNILERLRLRAGYNAMFLVNVQAAQDQINFDLATPDSHRKDHGTIFYHGPMLELQFLF